MTDHLCRRYRTKHDVLRYNRLGGRHGRFYSDTLYASEKSLHGNTVAQIFANNIGYTYLTPMKSKSEAPYALKEFIQDVGVPSQLHTDEAKELTIGRWKEICQTHGIKQTQTEPHSPFQNRAEINIREVKKLSRRLMHSTNCPKRLWDLCAKHVAELRCLTAQPLYSLHGRTPFEMVTGNTPDISEYISFQWYQPVWFFDNTSFPEPTKHIARWIGVAHNIGQAMCFWVLPSSGVPIARSTVQSITEAELRDPSVQSRLQSYDKEIEQKLQTPTTDDSIFIVEDTNERDELTNADEDGRYEPMEPAAEKPEADDYDEETYNRLVSAEVLLPKGDYEYIARVVGRKRDNNGNPIGQYNPNPLLDTTVLEVEFPDGTIQDYAANVVAEALFTQVDQDGNRFLLLKEIIGHEKDASAPLFEALQETRRRFTTKGWSLHCLWADGSTSWEALRNLKESNPIEVAQYAEQQSLLTEPAFAWWAKHVLKRSRRIVQKVKTRYWQRTHKFGVRLPKSVPEALQLDKENGNQLWYEAIQKELRNVKVAFKFLDEGESAPIGHKKSLATSFLMSRWISRARRDLLLVVTRPSPHHQ
jgi:hypothetical protein